MATDPTAEPGMPAQPSLAAGPIVLRPWREADRAALLDAGRDPAIARWAGLPQPFGATEAAAYLAEARSLWDEGARAAFAIVETAGGSPVGAVTRFGPDGHRATIGCWVAAGVRARGVGSTAIRALTDWTFATTAAVRVEAFLLAGNAAAERMMARAGFTREGVLRAWEPGPDGAPADVVAWSRLRDDP